jgi:hypothetical protein
MDGTLPEVSGLLSKREIEMNDEYRQQALDNFRNALGRLEQSDFEIVYYPKKRGIKIYIFDVSFCPDTLDKLPQITISNHTLRLKKLK